MMNKMCKNRQNIKKNQLVQISYNQKYQIAILVTR